MDVTEKLVLSDKNVLPTDDLLFSIMGSKKDVWDKIIDFAKLKYPGISEEWRYYNDGKQWLFKIQYKKKTVFWAGILPDTFRITFYFGNKAESMLRNSDLPDKIKSDFMTAKSYGKIRPVSIRVSGPADFDQICKLIDLKIKVK
jgi:hypothetical protein